MKNILIMEFINLYKKKIQSIETIIYNNNFCLICNYNLDKIDNIDGILICPNCNYCNDNFINLVNETTNFNGGDDNNTKNLTESYSKIDMLVPRSSMSSYITGKGFSSIKRLQLWDRIPAKERSLLLVFEIMKTTLQNTGYDGKILDDAKIYYYKLNNLTSEKKKDVLTRGDNRIGLIAYCVYISCEKNNMLINNHKIIELFNITSAIFNNGRKKYNLIYQHNENSIKGEKNYYKIIDYMKRFINHVDFTEHEKTICLVISAKVMELGILRNKQPISACAGLLYFMIQLYNKKYTKSYVSKISEKSEPTVFKVYTILENSARYFIPLCERERLNLIYD